MKSLQLYPNVNAENVSLGEYPLARGDPVDDLLIDRGTQRLGESVETFEGRDRAVVTANKALRFGVQLFRTHSRPQDLADMGQRPRHDLAGSAHDLDFARRLERDH